MTWIKMYRRATTTKALKAWSPLYSLDPVEVAAALIEGRW